MTLTLYIPSFVFGVAFGIMTAFSFVYWWMVVSDDDRIE